MKLDREALEKASEEIQGFSMERDSRYQMSWNIEKRTADRMAEAAVAAYLTAAAKRGTK